MKIAFMMIVSAAVLICDVATPAIAADTFKVTYEAPNVQNTTSTLAYKGRETFDAVPTGTRSFSTDFGTGGLISGTYLGPTIVNADIWGGSGGAGRYAATGTRSGYTLNLSTTDGRGINYFGAWLTSLDRGNQLEFLKAGQVVFTFSGQNATDMFANMPAYKGNPYHEPFAFLNFYDTNGTFDTVHFFQSSGNCCYESDNHTVGFYTQDSGTVLTVPEPAAWALMLVGFALVGAAFRYRYRFPQRPACFLTAHRTGAATA